MDKTRQNTDYGYDIQKLYLEMMLTDAESLLGVRLYLILVYLIDACKIVQRS